MRKREKILMVSSELYPFAQTGGLGDAVHSLSAALAGEGLDVRIVLPWYGASGNQGSGIQASGLYEGMKQLGRSLTIPVGSRLFEIAVYHLETPDKVTVYFLSNDDLYGGEPIYGVYSRPSTRLSARRFIALSLCAARLHRATRWYPDIIHAHDWPAALATVYSKKRRVLRVPRRVLTIHNFGFTGAYSRHEINETLLEPADFLPDGVSEGIEFLQAGMQASDAVTTVSPTYAKEVGSEVERSGRLVSGSLTGILNGIDYSLWNPAADEHLPEKYDVYHMDGKAAAKEAIEDLAGFTHEEDVPIIGMVSRLAAQKGFEYLCGSDGSVLQTASETHTVRFVILGTGDPEYENALEVLSDTLPNLWYYNAFDQKTAHLIEAGCDFFLMPSIYEPCGLNQLYSLRYGTIPIVTKTGGLADTVYDILDETKLDAGPGIVIEEAGEQEILHGISRAVALYSSQTDTLQKARETGMKIRFSWRKSAQAYIDIYQSLR